MCMQQHLGRILCMVITIIISCVLYVVYCMCDVIFSCVF